MNEKQSENNLLQRMVEFNKEDLKVKKSKQAHGYKYAPLDKIMDKVRPLLSKHGMVLYHESGYDKDEKKEYLQTFLCNADKADDYISTFSLIDKDVKLPGQNVFMVIGSGITYFRRYHTCELLGITSDTDNDAGGTRGKAAASTKESDGVEYIKIFENFIAKGKPEEAVKKAFEAQKSKMKPEELKVISSLIENKFENLSDADAKN